MDGKRVRGLKRLNDMKCPEIPVHWSKYNTFSAPYRINKHWPLFWIFLADSGKVATAV
jgi:hypothetical protein